MTKKNETKTVNKIILSGEELLLTMPKGRKGKDGVIKAQIPYENVLKTVRTKTNEEDLLRAARELFEYPGFQDEILVFVLQNTTKEFSQKEALDFLDENADSIIQVMFVYLTAMNFFLAGTDTKALQEAMGK